MADDEDAPSSFALHQDLVIAGVNESAASRKKTGDNFHLRTFRITQESTEKAETTSIKTLPQHQIYEDLSVELDDYQKVTKVNPDGKYAALISSEGFPALVDLKKMLRMPLDVLDSVQDGGKMKVVDIEMLKDSVWVADGKRIVTISLPTGDDVSVLFNLDKTGVPKNYSLSHMRIMGVDTVLLGMNHNKLQHAFIAVYKLYKGALIQCQVAHTSSRLRGLYINTRHATQTNPTLVSVTTSNGALHLYDAELHKLKSWSSLHQFPISTVSFRPDSRQLVTCSIDEKINVLDLTDLGTRSVVQIAALALLLFFLLMILAFFYTLL